MWDGPGWLGSQGRSSSEHFVAEEWMVLVGSLVGDRYRRADATADILSPVRRRNSVRQFPGLLLNGLEPVRSRRANLFVERRIVFGMVRVGVVG